MRRFLSGFHESSCGGLAILIPRKRDPADVLTRDERARAGILRRSYPFRGIDPSFGRFIRDCLWSTNRGNYCPKWLLELYRSWQEPPWRKWNVCFCNGGTFPLRHSPIKALKARPLSFTPRQRCLSLYFLQCDNVYRNIRDNASIFDFSPLE